MYRNSKYICIEISVFWDIKSRSSLKKNEVSGGRGHIASIFRVENYAKRDTSVKQTASKVDLQRTMWRYIPLKREVSTAADIITSGPKHISYPPTFSLSRLAVLHITEQKMRHALPPGDLFAGYPQTAQQSDRSVGSFRSSRTREKPPPPPYKE